MQAEAVPYGEISLLLGEITWNETIFRSFQLRYLKSPDLNLYLWFQYPTSQTMYRFLDKHFYRSSTLDLKTFACGHLGPWPSMSSTCAALLRLFL